MYIYAVGVTSYLFRTSVNGGSKLIQQFDAWDRFVFPSYVDATFP